jgi:hypothetical protein
LKSEFDIEFKNFVPRKTSEFDGYDAVFLGFGHTDCGEGKPQTLIRDSGVKLFPILNKEYTGLKNKLDWIREMRATAALSVHHDVDMFMSQTSIPFHRKILEKEFYLNWIDSMVILVILLMQDRTEITMLELCSLMMSMPDTFLIQNYVL